MTRTPTTLNLLMAASLWTCTQAGDDAYDQRRARDAGPGTLSGTFCTEECQTESDCGTGYQCTDHQCQQQTSPRDTCNVNLECVAHASGWAECDNNGNCINVQDVCVEGAYCARQQTTASPCATGMEAFSMEKEDGSGTVTVCGKPMERCGSDRLCFTACATEADCAGEYPACNVSTGECQCRADSCLTNASVCNNGVCQCAVDSDCTVGADHCYDGSCGCASLSACTTQRLHPNTQWVCQ
jgi:hypothetical protein